MTSLIVRRLAPSAHKLKSPISIFSSSLSRFAFVAFPTPTPSRQDTSFYHLVGFPENPTSIFAASLITLRSLNTSSSEETAEDREEDQYNYHKIEEEGETLDEWEEEDETEPEIGDGGDGGGVVLQNVSWGQRVLSIALEVLLQFGDGMKLFAFKTTPRGYIYVRLDKLSNDYGCPSMEEIEHYSQQYKKRLDEIGELGEIPDDLALEVSSPGAERLLKVPDDLHRFKDMPMRVCYVDDIESKQMEKNGVFFLDSIDLKSESCVWKLADVKENRDPLSKGRPFTRKQKDWRLKLPYARFTRVTLYLNF